METTIVYEYWGNMGNIWIIICRSPCNREYGAGVRDKRGTYILPYSRCTTSRQDTRILRTIGLSLPGKKPETLDGSHQPANL